MKERGVCVMMDEGRRGEVGGGWKRKLPSRLNYWGGVGVTTHLVVVRLGESARPVWD